MKSNTSLFLLATMCAGIVSAQAVPASTTAVSASPVATAEGVAAAEKFRERATFAEGLFRRKFYTEAAEEFEGLLKEVAEDSLHAIDFSLRLAECYAKTNRVTEARKLYNKVSSSAIEGDHRATARLRLAKLYRDAGDNEMALPFLETVVMDKKCAEALSLSARIEFAQTLVTLKRYDAAIAQYKALIQLSAEHELPAKLALIRIYNETKAYTEAMDLCLHVMQSPKASAAEIDEVAAFGFAVACQQGEYDRATTFVKNQNKGAFPRLTVAWVFLKTGDAEEANVWLADDKAAHPKATAERLALEVAICEALKDQVGALTACERLLAEFPEAPECKAAAATMLVIRARQGQPTPFLEAYKRVQDRLSDETKIALAPYRLDAALRTKDVISARAAAALLEVKGSPEQAADALYRIAWMAQEDMDWATAGETYLSVATKWPNSAIAGRAAYAAAYAFSRAGMNDRQTLAIQTALNTKDETIIPDALMLRARMELSEKNLPAASRSLDEYLTRFPKAKDAPEANYLRGLIFFQDKDFVPAEAALKKACELGTEANTTCRPLSHDRRIDAVLRRAQALHTMGHSDEAATLLQPIIEMKDAEKLDPTYLNWLAEFRLARQEWAMAEQAARLMVSRTEPNSAQRLTAHVLNGRAHEGLGNRDSALVAYLAAREIKLSPPTTKTIEAALGAGRLYAASGENEKARDAYFEVTKIANQDTHQGRAHLAEAYHGFATACYALKQDDEALRANMRLIIFFDKNTIHVEQAYRDAVKILEAKGATEQEKAKALREEFQAKYNKPL